MDRASILGDAIEYLKELLQRINDLHNELESAPSSSSMPHTSGTSFHPLTPTLPTLPCRAKGELCASSLPSPNSQPARVSMTTEVFLLPLFSNAKRVLVFCQKKSRPFSCILPPATTILCCEASRRVSNCIKPRMAPFS
ncbi:hypothetical protein B296_00026332 [Ensete ventricosum]|uniref:BHLH domain-containing protein n=1 Tax=Ensete ventricosum TaxID=4639 RepID=A0A426YG23_ENSVE|nr:hypothetical protein B296_00026332 [Ensete ventricosum]